jgi:branched-chain amino acid transport system ATP-binding protein
VSPLLQVDALVAGYEAGAPIVRGASLCAESGELVALIGPNGAGKSTLVKSIAGLVPIESGSVRLAGIDITALAAHARVRARLAFVPQTDNVFTAMSVADNLKLGAQALPATARAGRIDAVYALFPDLLRQRRLAAGRLSGGQRQMLAIARALVVEPRLLLLDEPSAGLSPKVVAEVLDTLRAICAAGVAILLVEQNVRAALAVADRVYVLVAGRNRLDGTPQALAGDPALAALYLGGGTPDRIASA